MADNLRTELLGIRRVHLAELRALRAMLINNKAKVTHILDQVDGTIADGDDVDNMMRLRADLLVSLDEMNGHAAEESANITEQLNRITILEQGY
jgi:urease gamma subunit